jgi:hypothetical protein
MDSSVTGVTIRNAHKIGNKIFRGSEPKSKFTELLAIGITDFLIFKNQTRDEVDTEIQNLKRSGIPASSITHIPFRWKDLESPQMACKQALKALTIVSKIEQYEGKKLFFHCSLGEDRTGMLSGLFRMKQQNWSLDQAFQKEMCVRGYEAGDPGKPKAVAAAVRKELTPVFLAMAKQVSAKKSIDCDQLNFDMTPAEQEKYRCGQLIH